MDQEVTCFYAYPSQPPILAETIESAIEQINIAGVGQVKVQSWKNLGVIGRLLIRPICEAIDSADVFICDLTTLNSNVLFELGYAIGKNKKVIITLDESYTYAKPNFEKFRLLTTVGYLSYFNASHLMKMFFEKAPYANLQSTLYRDVFTPGRQLEYRRAHLLYLKSEVNSEASSRVSTRLNKSDMPLVTDDPQEVPNQPFEWYVEQVYHSHAVLAHLTGETTISRLHQNAKYSLVSGMAYALHKPLLMLAQAPFHSPIDYRDILRVYETAKQGTSFVDDWLPEIERGYKSVEAAIQDQEKVARVKESLQRIYLGEYVAENERDDVLSYFIPTAAYFGALNVSQSMIYIGRKGSGKTANLYRLEADLRHEAHNHVCVIKPVDYELEGLLRLLNSTVSQADTGYLVASLWKFLIYTELAKSVYEKLQSRPLHAAKSTTEREFLLYVQENLHLITSDFTIRMETVIAQLCEIDLTRMASEHRVRVSEILHGSILLRLRDLLGKLLGSKNKVCVLVDNLDKAWYQRQELDTLANFLFGLLSVAPEITAEFHKQGPQRRHVEFALLIFLRSDIFAYLRSKAHEMDKLEYTRIDWTDSYLLKRVLEERFLPFTDRDTTPEEIWQSFFTETIKGVSTEQYILSRIIPRPRDLIFFAKASLASAVNYRHDRIEETDVEKAEREYSEFAFNSLLAELDVHGENYAELLVEFAGSPAIVTRSQIIEHISSVGIPTGRVDSVIETLCDVTFLGLETSPDTFEFIYDENRKKVLQRLARRTSSGIGQERYAINTAFHSYLEVAPTHHQ